MPVSIERLNFAKLKKRHSYHVATTARGDGKMSSEDKIYVDASQPATLMDGDKSIECPTLGEAVVALDQLPEPRQSAATIKIGGRVFTALEIDRLYHAKNKKAAAPRLRYLRTPASSNGQSSRACAIALAGEGVDVTLTARGAEALAQTANEIRKANPGIAVTEVVGDITTAVGREAKTRFVMR